ncbi:EamA family transporter [Reyranella sp.]|uniref:EamA family transporter n=1 Tax=Reyranella sp. TaxID=1929291 RepID=UPI0037832B26
MAVVATQFSNAWGAAWSKSLFAAIGPEGVIALRVGFSAILLGIVTQAWRLRVKRNQIGNVVAYGVALGLMNSIAYQAYARIPIGIGMAIEVTGPLAVVVFNSRRPADLAWVACAIAGLVLLLFRGFGDVAAVDPLGIAFAFGSAACWASYIVYGKRVSTLGGGSIAAAGLAIAFIFVVPFGLATTGAKLFRQEWLMAGLVIAILCSAIPFFLQIHAMRQLPSRVYGLLASAVPAVGAIMAYIVLGEALDLQQYLGILLVIVAGAGATLSLSRGR